MDFTFPLPDDPNSVDSGADSDAVVGDPGKIPDDSRGSVDVLGSDSINPGLDSLSTGRATEETRTGGKESFRPDSSSPGLDSRLDPPQAVDDPEVDSSAGQMEGKSSGEESAARGPAGRSESDENKEFKEEKTAEQTEEKGTQRHVDH